MPKDTYALGCRLRLATLNLKCDLPKEKRIR